jgi:tetratricopeptide (TPR) repeat protein
MNLFRRALGAISASAKETVPAPSQIAVRAPYPEGFAEAAAQADAGRERDAERLFRKVLAANPGHGGTMNRIGRLCAAAGREDEARLMLVDAVRAEPLVPEYHLDMAEFHLTRGMSADAAHACLEGLKLDPNSARAHHVMGVAFARRGLLVEAEARERRAIQFDPGYSAAHLALGELLLRLARFDEAVEAIRAAIASGDGSPRAAGQLCAALALAGRTQESDAELSSALDAFDDADALNVLGIAFLDADMGAQAERCYEKALRLVPDHPHARGNLALSKAAQLDMDGAAKEYRLLLRAQPNYPQGRQSQSMLLLRRGEWHRGWRELEWRYRRPEPGSPRARAYPQPVWRGQKAAGKTLLVHAEEGLGDTIQFVRFAPLAAEKGLRVVVEAQAPLVALLRRMKGVDEVVSAEDPSPPFDFHCPMLSLPIAFGTKLTDIPPTPYLTADPALVAAWAPRVARLPRGRPVGIVWSGNSAFLKDHLRSVPPNLLHPLLSAPGIRFVSLQKGGTSLLPGADVSDLMADVKDFSDTAALIANLELVISVDTSVVHLAGAMGKPVWLLNRYNACWRWLPGRQDSPWYPTMRVFGQPSPGDWKSVVAEVASELAKG